MVNGNKAIARAQVSKHLFTLDNGFGSQLYFIICDDCINRIISYAPGRKREEYQHDDDAEARNQWMAI